MADVLHIVRRGQCGARCQACSRGFECKCQCGLMVRSLLGSVRAGRGEKKSQQKADCKNQMLHHIGVHQMKGRGKKSNEFGRTCLGDAPGRTHLGDAPGRRAWETKQSCFVLIENAFSECSATSRADFSYEDETGLFRLPGTSSLKTHSASALQQVVRTFPTRTKQDCFVSQARPH